MCPASHLDGPLLALSGGEVAVYRGPADAECPGDLRRALTAGPTCLGGGQLVRVHHSRTSRRRSASRSAISTGQYALLHEVTGHVDVGSDGWCTAQFWLGHTALYSGDLAGALAHFTAVCDAIGDRGPSRVLVDCLAGRSITLGNQGRIPEAADDGRRSLALARELGYPTGEALALEGLSIAALCADDLDNAVRLARQAEQIPADIPGWIARDWSILLTAVLIAAGDLAAAERSCAAGLARSRDVGDQWNRAALLTPMVVLDLQAGRTGDAAAHLREGLQIAARTGGGFELANGLDCCGYLCAATGRPAEALTLWAAFAAFGRDEGFTESPSEVRRRREPLLEARQALGPARTRAAEERGAAMSLATAAEYALMLTTLGPEPPAAPGPGQLSARERELVTLVAQGRARRGTAPMSPGRTRTLAMSAATARPTWAASAGTGSASTHTSRRRSGRTACPPARTGPGTQPPAAGPHPRPARRPARRGPRSRYRRFPRAVTIVARETLRRCSGERINPETAQLVADAVQAALQPAVPSRPPRRRPRSPAVGSEPLF